MAPKECPTSCDWDCDTACHEGHQVPAKRRHDPSTCPGTLRVLAWENEYEAFIDAVTARVRDRPSERKGQAAFNTLNEVRPDLAKRVRSSRIDPFYDDARLSSFLAWLRNTTVLDAILAEIPDPPDDNDEPAFSANLTSCGGKCCGFRPIGTRLDVEDGEL